MLVEFESIDLRYFLSEMERESIKKSNQEAKKDIKNRKVPECEKALWKKYRKRVWDITKAQKLHKLPNFNKRGFKNYHLDHKVSIWYGYKYKLSPELIGGIDNLELIPYKDNMRKAKKCNMEGTENKRLQGNLFV